MSYPNGVPNAVVIQRAFEEWEVWDGGLSLRSDMGRWIKRGTFKNHRDAEEWAQKINGNDTC